MKKYNNLKLVLAGLILITAACKTEIDVPAASKGSADFSKYIAVGNSLTAGYADNGLYLEGQLNSYPSIIAKQMKSVGGGDFKQPLFTEAQSDGSGYLKFAGFNADGTPNIVPVKDKLAVRGEYDAGAFGKVTLYTKFAGDNNNFGVPGIKLQQITFAPYGNLNGYFERLLPGNAGTNNTTYLDFVTAKPFTFFTSWLGNNDALGYATSGGVGDVLTPKDQFLGLYNALIAKLTANGAKGAIATIPDVSSIPFLTTVTVKALLDGAKKLNPAFQAVYIQTAAGNRIATDEDLITLSFNSTGLFGKPNGSMQYYGLHPSNPIQSQYVLDKTEVATARDYVNSYNATIKSIATAKKLAIFDAYSFLNTLNVKHVSENGQPYTGVFINGINVSSSFITGNAFSLDGVHLTPKGYAIVANEFIKAINAQYGSTIPQANLSDYRSVKFP
ncbi:SGNH/GDSL hydrolase family protein [Pedobacter arcticus]|uniref:SGNH/GDSL hydrolase family protein n=1 Tax=Pedobacter arcticus TaxID=752140 RepID=UPI0002D8DCA7|nr:SGNH/GDSL hydrolase family protein [Pedobacter arcticus]